MFSIAKPCIDVSESLLLNGDLQEVEKQLLSEWKRFRHVSLNNNDPHFKPQNIMKLFQVKTRVEVQNTTETEPRSNKVIVEQESDNNVDATINAQNNYKMKKFMNESNQAKVRNTGKSNM